MAAEDFAEILSRARLNVPRKEVEDALPAARKLLEAANRLPEKDDD